MAMRLTCSLSRQLLSSAVRGANPQRRRTLATSSLSSRKLASPAGSSNLLPTSLCLGRGRLFSTSNPDNNGDLRMPSLMDFPKRLFPNVVNTARNWFLATTLITPYFDNGGSCVVEY